MPLGVRAPDGFAVTALAYRDPLCAADAWPQSHRLLDQFEQRDIEIVYAAPMP